jgi:uncharacterized protein
MADNESINTIRRSTRGFASMDPAKRREIAKKGGHAAHQKGTAHEFTPEEARAAGRKGGERSRASHNLMANGQTNASGPGSAQPSSVNGIETAASAQVSVEARDDNERTES